MIGRGEARRERKFNFGAGLSIADRLLCRLEFETEGSLASRVPFTGLKIIVASPVTSDACARLIHQPCFYYRLLYTTCTPQCPELSS